ncbi:MAG: coproporphyrinogen III oxidase family protein [Planctomycetota bacterium]|nr:MAG: coproporphyrinogen III oxidase family protein [Planctomycetota bacterium]REJ86919.1 MAG: coproporphyrinogen III oxidase family protein [Planctomycetota bacterium]REK24954.1 MAG: coproporphyrinogen III oxidase family protein [Planctomycetota bacterium]REK48543.1 MAG: coproporphyrinogen III oxidase family protein [Planctomycetota bacterium]
MIVSNRAPTVDDPYVGYSYAYPHKSAYRQLAPTIPLETLWANEQLGSLFLYLHIPFCEYRCGFCNLFTLARPDEDLVAQYLRQLRIEAAQVRDAIPDATFARVALGGGTPTFLNDRELAELLDIVSAVAGSAPQMVPVSCEASPATLTAEKAGMLRAWGVDRISIGVQSFIDAELGALGRPQDRGDVRRAIEIVRLEGFPVLNVDLIFGVEGQTTNSWLTSVNETIEHRPEEIYLYPLYVREHTGLGSTAKEPNQERLDAYRSARARLLDAGYLQRSLRMFQLPEHVESSDPVYCCQSDGMVGLGCGARSYTKSVHYSTEFAVGRQGVRSILADYLARQPDAFRSASHGIVLDGEDQRRRFTIQSILQADGLSLHEYQARFASNLFDDLPELQCLIERELAVPAVDRIRLTDAGLELSDAIGPWLYSSRVRRLMESFQCH